MAAANSNGKRAAQMAVEHLAAVEAIDRLMPDGRVPQVLGDLPRHFATKLDCPNVLVLVRHDDGTIGYAATGFNHYHALISLTRALHLVWAGDLVHVLPKAPAPLRTWLKSMRFAARDAAEAVRTSGALVIFRTLGDAVALSTHGCNSGQSAATLASAIHMVMMDHDKRVLEGDAGADAQAIARSLANSN